MKRNRIPESGKFFVCGRCNPGFWNLEYRSMNSGLPLTTGIRNVGIQNLEYWRLSWTHLHGARKGMLSPFSCSAKEIIIVYLLLPINWFLPRLQANVRNARIRGEDLCLKFIFGQVNRNVLRSVAYYFWAPWLLWAKYERCTCTNLRIGGGAYCEIEPLAPW